MNHIAIYGMVAALIIGLTIGFQGIISARLSLADNAVSTGIVVLILGGILAAILMAMLYPTGQFPTAPITTNRLFFAALGGIAGIIIVVGSAFVFANVSPPAAVALIIFGQMSFALVADYFGWSGQEAHSIDLRRAGGLVMLAAAVWMLMPRSDS